MDCIRSGKDPLLSGEEARKDLEIVMAAYKSMETDGRVKLPLLQGV